MTITDNLREINSLPENVKKKVIEIIVENCKKIPPLRSE